MLGVTADQLAKTTGCLKRQRQLTGVKAPVDWCQVGLFLTLGLLSKLVTTLEELTPSGVLTEVELSPPGGE